MNTANPITSWIKSGMETYKEREDSMVDRVANCAIASQKIVDERHGPYHSHMWWREEVRPRVRNNLYVANSSHKFKDEGYVNSFKAARYYSGKAAERRDALLEKIRKEEGSA